MKNILYLLSFLFVFSLNAQKNKNGNLYDKHPGIDLVSSFHQAVASGDLEKASEILHENVKWYDGNTNDREIGGKEAVLRNINWFKNYFDYVSFNDSPGAYPDALEYKKDGNWVQSWFNVYGVHKTTGVELDHPVLRLYSLNDDSTKIAGIIEYSNKLNFRQIGDARTDMKNGVVYMNHENINTVRKWIYSFLNKDYDRSYSFWSPDAVINNINLPWGTSLTLEEAKKSNEEFLKVFDLVGIDEIGYPDYIEYDWLDSKTVLSWWMYKFVRKSDGKEIEVPVHHSNDFNDEGKISGSFSYWNQSLLD
jgi:ketosteroid isomerase-like protein